MLSDQSMCPCQAFCMPFLGGFSSHDCQNVHNQEFHVLQQSPGTPMPGATCTVSDRQILDALVLGSSVSLCFILAPA